MAQEHCAKVFFNKSTGAPTQGLGIMVCASDNYAVIKGKANEIIRQQGARPLDAPTIHVIGPGHPEKSELKGSTTLVSMGIAPAESTKKLSISIYINLPPEPKRKPLCLIL
ncbi:hypothetical protein LPJ61_006442 [Coemansia biformis]|uniref:Uncharacterized protein n=1 Tax=Coemansia biformis TaxID=1286918 RepID=A0A9W7XUR1_9FUNG|nr:hypothetical protein LPJ61_006442 [Coemansia biformis]